MTLPPLSAYVHIPWCVRKCPYCDFNSHRAPSAIPQARYVDALLADLARDAPLAAGRRLRSVFFGGGTPSLFDGASIARIIEGLDRAVGLEADAEITLEANPGASEYDRFSAYRDAGVNRLSFGVQSFDAAALRALGRIHGPAEALEAVAKARAAGFDNFNLDLMYALPAQTLGGALADIDAAIALAPTHLSHYQLTLEPNTEFAARPPALPDDELAFEIQKRCTERLAESGYRQYETSAWARSAAQCQHNLGYWTFADYLGLGAGAHGKLTHADGRIERTTKLKVPANYLARFDAGTEFGSAASVAPDALPFEFMLNALRLNAGFELALFEQRTGLDRERIAQPLARGVARGLLQRRGTHVQPTALGQRFLNDTIELFMD